MSPTLGPIASTPTSNPPGRRERNKAEKLRRIRAAAARLFAEQGFDATTTDAVAAAADIAKGTLFLYAPTKQDLLAGVFVDTVGEAWNEAFRRIDSSDPILEQLTSAFDWVTAFHERDPELSRAMLKELQFVSGSARDELNRFMVDWHRRLAAVLVAAIERGELRAGTPADDLGFNLFAAWYTLVQQHHAGRLTIDECRQRYRRSFTVQISGHLAAT